MTSFSESRSLHDNLLEDMSSYRSYSENSNIDMFQEVFESGKSQFTKVIRVFDMRGSNGSFVRGGTEFHNCKEVNSLIMFIQGKYKAQMVLIEPNETMESCIIIDMDQTTNVQLLVSFPFETGNDDEIHERPSMMYADRLRYSIARPKVLRCISVPKDKCASFLFEKYTQYHERADSMFCSNRSLLVRHAQASQTSVQLFSTFDKLHFYQDCLQSLRIVHHLDEQREITFHLQSLKCDSVKDIQEKLESKFDELQCQRDNSKCLWITDSTSVLKPSDYIFLQEKGFDGSLFVHISHHDSLAIKFIFRKEPMVVILPKDATVKDFREYAGKVLHKPANSLKVICNKEKCDDATLISEIQHHQTPLVVELAKEKTLTFTKLQHGETSSDMIEIKVYKMDTMSNVKIKLTSVLGVDPFYIKLVQNASFLDNEATVHSSRIQASDRLQIIICPNRVQITLRCKKEQRSLVVDDIMITTVSDLKNFCGHVLQCHPLNICIFFKGTVLINYSRTLHEEGVVHGSRLFVVITCQDAIRNQEGTTLYIQGCENGIQKRKAIIHRGRVIPVDDNIQFDDPDTPVSQQMMHPRPRGIQIVETDKASLANASCCLQKSQRTHRSEGYTVVMGNDQAVTSVERRQMAGAPVSLQERQKLILIFEQALSSLRTITEPSSNMTMPVKHPDKDASMTQSNVETSMMRSNMELALTPSNIPSLMTSSCQKTTMASPNLEQSVKTLNLVTSHLTPNIGTPPTPLAVARGAHPSEAMPSTASRQTCNISQSNHMLCSEVQHVITSPHGEIVLAEKTQSMVFGSQDKLKGLSHSASDNILSSYHSPYMASASTPTIHHLQNAIPERLLNALADELGNSWSDLALELSIAFKDVTKITHTEPKDLKRQALTMLHNWQRANGSNATIDVLCDGLRRCQLVSIAEWLEEKTSSSNYE